MLSSFKCYIQFYSILKFKGIKWSNAAGALPKGNNPCSLLLLENIGIVALTAQTLCSSRVSKLDTPSTIVVLVRINDDGHQMHRTLSVGARDKTQNSAESVSPTWCPYNEAKFSRPGGTGPRQTEATRPPNCSGPPSSEIRLRKLNFARQYNILTFSTETNKISCQASKIECLLFAQGFHTAAAGKVTQCRRASAWTVPR